MGEGNKTTTIEGGPPDIPKISVGQRGVRQAGYTTAKQARPARTTEQLPPPAAPSLPLPLPPPLPHGGAHAPLPQNAGGRAACGSPRRGAATGACSAAWTCACAWNKGKRGGGRGGGGTGEGGPEKGSRMFLPRPLLNRKWLPRMQGSKHTTGWERHTYTIGSACSSPRTAARRHSCCRGSRSMQATRSAKGCNAGGRIPRCGSSENGKHPLRVHRLGHVAINGYSHTTNAQIQGRSATAQHGRSQRVERS